MTTTDLFADLEQSTPQEQTLHFLSGESPEERATRRVKTIIHAGHVLALAFSSGKDSSALASIVLNACRAVIESNKPCPPIIILHSDTGMESPVVWKLARGELKKIKAYADQHGIDLTVRITKPSLNASFPVRVIGGRGLPPFPDNRSACSVDWKVLPNQKALKQIMQRYDNDTTWKKPVVMTGVRNQESIARDIKIAKRGEVAESIWENEFGLLRSSPILDFDESDVWEYIAYCNSGVIPAYSDFEAVMQIYRDGGGDKCVIVADMKSAGNSKPCGTRTGCWSCTKVSDDKSMMQMIASDPGTYGKYKPLAELRNFISNTQYDWSLRQFVGRSIDSDGNIEIGADTYSPQMLQDLLRYTLSAQAVTGVQIISIEQLIAIDARWSMYALCPPFKALQIYLEVEAGKITLAPDVKRFPKTDVPKLGKIHVGASTFNESMAGNVSGLRNVMAEMFSESCGPELRRLKDGSLVMDIEAEGEFEVDREGASLFLEFEAQRMIDQYARDDCLDWTWGYKTYLQYGTLRIAPGRSSQTHEILQRSQWRQMNGLHGKQDIASLEARCIELYSKQFQLI